MAIPCKNHNKFWTKNDQQKLMTYHDNGKSWNEIAILLDRTPTSVETKFNRIQACFLYHILL